MATKNSTHDPHPHAAADPAPAPTGPTPTPLANPPISHGGSYTILTPANAWHPTITLAMVQAYDPGVWDLTLCVVLPDGWTGPGAGPPAGTGIAHA